MSELLQPERCARLLGALASPERLRIVRCLSSGARSVTEVAAMLKRPAATASHHLRVLRDAGLVCRRPRGRFVLYSLPPDVSQPDEVGSTIWINLGCCRLEIAQRVKGPSATS